MDDAPLSIVSILEKEMVNEERQRQKEEKSTHPNPEGHSEEKWKNEPHLGESSQR
jgi:hypothetical protein